MIAALQARSLLVVWFLLASGSPALAQAPLSSSDGIRATQLLAQVRIVDGVATTTLQQTLHNDRNRLGEAIWILPLPENSVADGFSMTVAGVEMKADVLDSEHARDVYESIVRQRRDPGLLEYVGRGCLRARIFPIPPGAEVQVQVVYRNVVPALNGLMRWSLPLNAVGIPGRSPENLVLDLAIESSKAIRNVFSPSSGVRTSRHGEHHASASYESALATGRDSELAVFYGLSEKEFGVNLLSYREQGTDEGTFLMMISPKQRWGELAVVKRSMTFVIDTSGSMAGQKIVQAKQAVRFFLNSLHEEDHFNVVPFSQEAEPFFASPVVANPVNIEHALKKVERIEASGGTNVGDALRRALEVQPAPGDRLPCVIFLTDGQPTIGEKNVQNLLTQAKHWNREKARVFVFGVGNDVNTLLLDKLAVQSHGTHDYVREQEAIEEKTGALLTRISNPVLTDLKVSVDGVELSRRVPAQLPDLFRDSRILLFGRYFGEGTHALRLSGKLAGRRMEYVYEGNFAAEVRPSHDFVPALWAERRVGVLLDTIRLNGTNPELMDEIVRLGREHNIVTPYTSHLIVEAGLGINLGRSRAQNGTAAPATTPSRPRRGAAWQGRRTPPIPVPVGGGGGGPSSPGPSGPSAPGPRGPATAGPASPGATRSSHPPVIRQQQIIDRLLDAGVLPPTASRSELRKLASEIVREMQASSSSLKDLGGRTSGAQAVTDSAYLAHLIAGSPSSPLDARAAASKARVMALFVRKIGTRTFHLQRGIWVDDDYSSEPLKQPKITVEAFSDEYFKLLRENPKLSIYFAFSARLIVVFEGRAYEVKQ